MFNNFFMWMFQKIGVPQIIHVHRGFHYKPSILGYVPLFLETPICFFWNLWSKLSWLRAHQPSSCPQCTALRVWAPWGYKPICTRWWQLKYLFIFTPIPGEMLQFDGCIFFKWVGSTTNYCNLYQMDGSTFEFGGPGKVVSTEKCLRGASFLSTQLWGNFREQCHNDLNQWTCDFFGIARIDMQWLHHQCGPSCSQTASRNFDCFWICSTSKAWILHLTSLLDGNSLGHRLLKIDIGSIRDFL